MSADPACKQRLAVSTALALTLALTMCGCGAPTYQWRDERPVSYRIGPADKLRVAVWRHDEVSQEVTVRPDGSFSLPLVGDVVAAGRSGQEIGREVEARLAQYYTDKPPVTVLVTEVRSYKLYFFGEIQKPGEYVPTQPVTVLMGLAMAGSLTTYAKADHIVIVRRDARGERRIPFSYSAVVKDGDMQQNIILQPGDTIVVP